MIMNTDKLIENLSGDLQPVGVTPCPYKIFTKSIGLALLYIILVLAIVGVRDDIVVKLALPLFMAEIFALAFIIASGLLAAFFLSFPDICQKKSVLFYPVISLFLFMVVMGFEYVNDSAANIAVEHGIECILVIGLLSFIPAFFIFRAIRKQASTYCCTTGFVTLLTSTSIGALILRLAERTDSIDHIISWHYLPLIGFGMIGMIIGKKILKW